MFVDRLSRAMDALERWARTEDPQLVGLVLGACIGGYLGGLSGLFIGLDAYPPTAWFAVIELGIPASAAGAVVGCFVGTVKAAIRRRRHRRSGW